MGSSGYLKHKTEADHLSKASQNTKALYYKYKEAILKFGNDVTINPTEKKYIGFRVNDRRFANFHIHPSHFKIWLRIKPGTIYDPNRLTNQTETGHTISISDDQHLDYVVGLLKQAYLRNR